MIITRSYKRAAIASAVIIGTPLAGLAFASSASAHDGGITATCNSLTANLTNYPAGSTIGGTLDGLDLGTSTFGPSFSQTATLDPAVPHVWSITVTSGDGDPRYTFTTAGTSDPACIPVVVPPVEEPPVVVVPPAPVFYVQDFIDCLGGRFVLDNTSNDVDATYTVNGVAYLVPAGSALHTDADGTIIQPNTALGAPYTITAGEQTWTFPSSGNCPTTPPVTTDPEPTTPPVVLPPTDEPTEPSTPPVTPSAPATTPGETGATPNTSTPATPQSSQPNSPTTVQNVAATAPDVVPTASPDEQRAEALAFTGTSDVIARIALAAVLLAAGFGIIISTVLRRRRAEETNR